MRRLVLVIALLALASGCRPDTVNLAFRPKAGERFHALLCDMNGPAESSMREVVRIGKSLAPGALVIFTLKSAGAGEPAEMLELGRRVTAVAAEGGLQLIAATHLTYNRREFTLAFEKSAPVRNEA